MTTYVYEFSQGNKDPKDVLGANGADLAEMTNLGLPVPVGFTIVSGSPFRVPVARLEAGRAAVIV